MRHCGYIVAIMGMVMLLAAAALAGGAPSQDRQQPRQVLVTRFTALTHEAAEWIGKAVQGDLVADLSRLSGTSVRSVEASFDSPLKAIAAANDQDAQQVLIGSYQVMEGNLRISGRLLEASTGATIGTVSAQGQLRDLFALEDELSGQLKKLIVPAAAAPATQPVQIAGDGPVRKGDYGPYGIYGMYDGSSLQRAIEGGGLGVPPAPKSEGESNSSYWYRYGTPYYPWYGWYPRYYYYPGYYTLPQVYHPQFTPPANPPPPNTQGYVPMTQGYVPMTLRP